MVTTFECHGQYLVAPWFLLLSDVGCQLLRLFVMPRIKVLGTGTGLSNVRAG
jgi:hypothetical protein